MLLIFSQGHPRDTMCEQKEGVVSRRVDVSSGMEYERAIRWVTIHIQGFNQPR